MIKTVSYAQDEILQGITSLYLDGKPFEVDATFSKGIFYRSGAIQRPIRCFDITPQSACAERADCRHLPLEDGTVGSMMIDLPFLATSGASLGTEDGNLMSRRFGVYPNESALYHLYQDALLESLRVLKGNGILVMKCQDKVSSGKQYMMHCDIYQWATNLGFVVEDLFVLLARARLVAAWQRAQRHARKYHCYFWVFRKPKGRRREIE